MAKASKPVDQDKLHQKIADFAKKQKGLKIPRDGLIIMRAGSSVKVSVNSTTPTATKKPKKIKPVKKADIKVGGTAPSKKVTVKKAPKKAPKKKPPSKKK